MKKKLFLFTFGLHVCFMQSKAQLINPASSTEFPVSTSFVMPASNTGVAIAEIGSGASLIQATAVVADDNIPTSSYEINWYDQSGTLLDAEKGDGSDPDVAYYSNADFIFVGYNNTTSTSAIWLDSYQLFGGGGINYTLANSWFVANGNYPNIDHNSGNGGIGSYQIGNNLVFAYAFDVNTGPGPVTTVSLGSHPDVVVLNNPNRAVITYVRNGNLHVRLFDYVALQGGSFVPIASFNFPASGEPYDYPRIAAARNCVSPDLYTVVAERTTGSGSNIEAFTFNGSTLVASAVVNPGLQNCTNTRPVVTYNCDRISIAFSSDYTSCSYSVTPPDPIRTDIIHADFNLALGWVGGQYYEVNSAAGLFAQGNVSLNCNYDPLLTSTTTFEVATYTDDHGWYWKWRNYLPDQFRLAAPSNQAMKEIEKNTLNVSLAQNPVTSSALLRAEDFEGIQLRLMNQIGQQIDLSGRVSNRQQEVRIDVQDLPAGMYFIQCEKEGALQVIKMVHN